MDADQAARMDYSEIIRYVLRPAFSTRDSVSEISGRGVGLDAVQEGLASIQGGLEISGVKGSGTTIRMSVPLAIAATEVIVGTLGGHPVGFPLVETDRIVDEARPLFDYLRTRFGIDFPSAHAEIEPPPDPEALRRRLTEHLLQIVMHQADRITALETAVAALQAAPGKP